MKQQSFRAGIIMVLLATVCWSLAGMFVRLVPGLNGWQINCWRGFSMGVVLMLWLLLIYGRNTPARFREIPLGAMISSAGFFALGSTMYVTALTFTSTANVSALGATAPVFTGIMAGLIMKERASLAAWIAAMIALAGVTFIVREGLSPDDWLGNLIALATAFAFAGQTVTLRRYRSFDMIPAIAVGGFATFALAGLAGGFFVPAETLAVLCLMGLIQLAIPLVLYARGAKSVPAITLSLIALMDVVLNPFWSWAVMREMPTSAAIIGGLVICAAVMISVLGTPRAPTVEN
jgi:drug/metabolite transporter (DMT)-like permease